MTVGLAATLVAFAVLLALLGVHFFPASNAVRVRNALLLEPSAEGDFSWVPPRFPPGFKVEHRPADPAVLGIVGSLRLDAVDGDWAKAIALAAHLTDRALDKGPVHADPLTTYRAIREGYGYCSDYVKVFLALAYAAGLVCRQWAFSFDGFGGHGHTIVEVYDRRLGRWLMIDVYNNFHVIDDRSGQPLSGLEYRDALLERRSGAAMRPNGSGRPGFVHQHKALEYYRNGVDQWYLWWGNAVLSYYAHPAVRCMGRFSRTLAHVVANLVGVQPRIHVYPTAGNADAVRRMFALKRRVWAIGLTAVVVAALLAAQFSASLVPRT